MIGFVEVEVELIKKAYGYLEQDEDVANEALKSNTNLMSRVNFMADVINVSAGKRSYFKKTQKYKLKKMLQEVTYASFASNSKTMFIRVEMASIILDIIQIYNENMDEEIIGSDDLEYSINKSNSE